MLADRVNTVSTLYAAKVSQARTNVHWQDAGSPQVQLVKGAQPDL